MNGFIFVEVSLILKGREVRLLPIPLVRKRADKIDRDVAELIVFSIHQPVREDRLEKPGMVEGVSDSLPRHKENLKRNEDWIDRC